MDQHDDLNGQSHQDTQYVNENKSRSRRNGTKWKDKTNIPPKFQSARHEMRQNFEHHEIQPLIAISPRPLYGRRRGDHQWKYESLHEAQKNFGYEDQSGTKRRSKQRNWDRVTDREMRLKQADRSSHQGHVPLDDRKHGDLGYVPLDDRKHGDLGQVPLDDRKHGDLDRVPLADQKHGNLGHVASNKWNHGDQGPVRSDDLTNEGHGHVPFDVFKHGDMGHVASNKWNHGDQGPVPLDDRKHGDLGHVPLDDRKHGDLGHVPLDDRKHGDLGHVLLDDRKHGDLGHVPLDDQKHGDLGHVLLDDRKHGDLGHVPLDDRKHADLGQVPLDDWNHGHASSDDRKSGDQGAAYADGQAWENCTPSVMEFLRSVRPHYQNQAPYANEKSGDGDDETNCTANEVKAGKIESPRVQQGDNLKEDNNDASGGASKAMVGEGLTEFAGVGHDETHSTANKVKTEKINSPNVEQDDEAKGSRNESDCNVGKNEANGGAGKAMSGEDLTEFAGDGHDETHSTANKVKTEKINSPNVEQDDEAKGSRNESDCNVGKNEASGTAGKVMSNESLTEFAGDGHDTCNSTANKVNTRKKKNPKPQKVDDLKDNKNNGNGAAGKVMNNESLAEFGGDGQDKTNPTANKVKHRKVNSPNVQQVGDLKNNKNNGTGAPGKVMNNESLTEFGGDGHDRTNPTANKVKTRQIKSPNVQQVDDLKDNKNKASGGAGKVMGDGHSSRGGKNTIRYIPGQEMAEIEQRAGQREDTYNEVNFPMGKKKAGKSETKRDERTGIVFTNSQFRYKASNHEARCADGESAAYQNQERGRGNNSIEIVNQDESSDVNAGQGLARFADGARSRGAGRNRSRHTPEDERVESSHGVGQQKGGHNEIRIPSNKKKAGKSEAKPDGKTGSILKNSQSRHRTSSNEGYWKDGDSSSAAENKIRGKENDKSQIVDNEESYEQKKKMESRRMEVTSSSEDTSGREAQKTARETSRRTNFKSLAEIVKKQVDENARHSEKGRSRQRSHNVSRNRNDDMLQTKNTNCRTVSVDYDGKTAQNSPRAPKDLTLSKRLEEGSFSARELRNSTHDVMVPLKGTCPEKEPDKANRTECSAKSAGVVRNKAEVDARSKKPTGQLTFEPTYKKAVWLENSVNSLPTDQCLQSTFHGADNTVQGIDRAWSKILTDAKIQIEKHRAKSVEVREQINDLEDEKAKKKWVTVDEYERRSETRVPLKQKISELEKQEREFCRSLDQLKKDVDRLKFESRPENGLNLLRSRFSRELKRFDTALPLYARKSDIVNTILANSVSIILGETGSGKSSQMVQYLHEAGMSKGGVIVCTQPRKVAALSLARHVAQQMKCKLGTLVGYHVGSKSCYGPGTHLMYVTDNALLNDCLQDAMFSKYSCIIIDEAHERSLYTDLLLGFVKKALAVRRDLKVVITSATIDPKVFVHYFSSGNFVPPVLKVSGRAFPVDVFYEEHVEDYVSAACEKALDVHWTEPPGDILVFLSSPIETERACKRFQIQVTSGEAVMMELHGRLQVEDQQKVFEILPPEKRKVVFATNCAETSITIPGIKYVIDTGRVREVSYDPLKNMSTLRLTWVTKSSADQRKGRAGRTDCGKCFRLYTEDQYKHDMRPVPVPEILRVHLGQALLKISSLGVSNPSEFEFVESPSVAAIEAAMLVLRELGAYGNRVITDLGRKLAKISLEPRLGKAALLGLEQKIAYETLVMAVMASFGGNVFFRVGTDEQKQEADKKKTRFCDQWGDIVTLVNVYKEWERVPKSRQGAWCVENSINGKSMKMARELLREILTTFKRDLKVVIRKRWSRQSDLNYRLAKIVFHCYSSNLCRYSGHPRGGYYLARLPNVTLQLHPSSAFNYMEDFPRWVVYEQVFTTSRTFMQNTSYVDELWIREKITKGQLSRGLFHGLERRLLEPSIICTVGATCMNRLLAGKAQELKRMENCLKELSDENGEKVTIDLATSDGTVTVYTTKSQKEAAVREITARISIIRKSIQDECIEQPLRTGASVQLILEKGAKIRTILMPQESRQVKISRVSDELAGDVEGLLSVYGEIETTKLLDHRKDHRGQDQRETWGFVTYKFPESAQKVLEDAAVLPFQLELQKRVLQTVNRIEDFKVKVKVCRRRQRDFGFVKFKDAFHAALALKSVNSIRVENRDAPCPPNFLNDYVFSAPNCNQNVQQISLIPDSRNSKQMYLKRIPQWANKRMIWDAIAKAIDPGLVIEEVTVARERPPPAVLSAAMFAKFCQAIRSKLWINGNLWEFQLHAVPPTDRAYYMTAYVAFSNAYQAQVARDLLNDSFIVGSTAVAAVELRTSVFVSGPIFRLFGAKILAETEAAVNNSGGGLSIQMVERRNGGHAIQLEATSLDRLKEGKSRIDGIINGLEVTLDLKRFSHLKSADGKRFLDMLQRETQSILRLDERRQAVFVHGGRKSAEDVKNRLCKYLFTDFPERVVDIQLRGSGFPNGLMKVLVVRYGSNLERLKDLSGATTVELFLRKHVIQVQGSDESVQRLKELIEAEARRIPRQDAAVKSSLPNCPVCLGPVELESSYIMEYCGHIYCKECALSLIDNGLENNEIPIQCAAEGCSQDVTIRDLRNLPVDINKVFDTAIRAFVQTNSAEFGYCITADCPMVYRKARENKNGELFQCSECQLRLCTACASEFHHGMSCEVYRCLQGEDNDIKTWLTERPKDRSLCPQCKMGIEKNGGCMHVECTACHVHICWRCKSTFSASARCYDHLTKCGGIFGNENIVL